MEPKAKRLELKICERCGGLWLRPAASGWAYCGPCRRKLEELPRRNTADLPAGKDAQHEEVRR